MNEKRPTSFLVGRLHLGSRAFQQSGGPARRCSNDAILSEETTGCLPAWEAWAASEAGPFRRGLRFRRPARRRRSGRHSRRCSRCRSHGDGRRTAGAGSSRDGNANGKPVRSRTKAQHRTPEPRRRWGPRHRSEPHRPEHRKLACSSGGVRASRGDSSRSAAYGSSRRRLRRKSAQRRRPEPQHRSVQRPHKSAPHKLGPRRPELCSSWFRNRSRLHPACGRASQIQSSGHKVQERGPSIQAQYSTSCLATLFQRGTLTNCRFPTPGPQCATTTSGLTAGNPDCQ